MKDTGGNVMSGVTVSWTTSAASVATVSSAGLVTAVADGTATVTATFGSLTATTSVTVAQVDSEAAISKCLGRDRVEIIMLRLLATVRALFVNRSGFFCVEEVAAGHQHLTLPTAAAVEAQSPSPAVALFSLTVSSGQMAERNTPLAARSGSLLTRSEGTD